MTNEQFNTIMSAINKLNKNIADISAQLDKNTAEIHRLSKKVDALSDARLAELAQRVKFVERLQADDHIRIVDKL